MKLSVVWSKYAPLLTFAILMFGTGVMSHVLISWLMDSPISIAKAMVVPFVVTTCIVWVLVKMPAAHGKAFVKEAEMRTSLNWRDSETLKDHLKQHPKTAKWSPQLRGNQVILEHSKMFGLHRWTTTLYAKENGLYIECVPQGLLNAWGNHESLLYALDVRAAFTP